MSFDALCANSNTHCKVTLGTMMPPPREICGVDSHSLASMTGSWYWWVWRWRCYLPYCKLRGSRSIWFAAPADHVVCAGAAAGIALRARHILRVFELRLLRSAVRRTHGRVRVRSSICWSCQVLADEGLLRVCRTTPHWPPLEVHHLPSRGRNWHLAALGHRRRPALVSSSARRR